jgi:hypothetical protein
MGGAAAREGYNTQFVTQCIWLWWLAHAAASPTSPAQLISGYSQFHVLQQSARSALRWKGFTHLTQRTSMKIQTVAKLASSAVAAHAHTVHAARKKRGGVGASAPHAFRQWDCS